MSLFVIGDLHLSLGCDKPMDVFGGRWENYIQKLNEGFSLVKDGDTTVICGDLTWGMTLDEAEEDFRYIHRIPGRKIILKGNHDYWWSTANKAKTFFAEKDIDSIDILNNNCFFYEDIAICGTRGWAAEGNVSREHDKKMTDREVLRLEASLKAAGDREKIVFLHYPPKMLGYECTPMLELMERYGVKKCYYGHLHSAGRAAAFEGESHGIRFRLISSDHLLFIPLKIM